MAPVSLFRLLLGWMGECFWFLLFCLHQLLPVPVPAIKGRRPQTVIILTDILTHPLYYFRLRSRIARLGFSVRIAHMASPFRGYREHSKNLSKLLAEWNIKDGILIGHGCGALAALSLPDAGRQRIEHFISLGAPIHGSALYRTCNLFLAFRDCAANSEFLLLNTVNALLFPSFTPFSAYKDQFIYPVNNGRFGQGRDLIFDLPGRWNLIWISSSIKVLTDFLKQEYPLPRVAVDYLPPEAKKQLQKHDELPSTEKKSQKKSPTPAKKTRNSKK